MFMRVAVLSPVVRYSSSVRFVILALFSVNGLCFTEANAVDFPVLTGRKSKNETAQIPNPVLDASIRNLMQRAKSLNEKGEVERAIELADQAVKMSQSVADNSKLAIDVSPSATAALARELRKNKTELDSKHIVHKPKNSPRRFGNPSLAQNSSVQETLKTHSNVSAHKPKNNSTAEANRRNSPDVLLDKKPASTSRYSNEANTIGGQPNTVLSKLGEPPLNDPKIDRSSIPRTEVQTAVTTESIEPTDKTRHDALFIAVQDQANPQDKVILASESKPASILENPRIRPSPTRNETDRRTTDRQLSSIRMRSIAEMNSEIDSMDPKLASDSDSIIDDRPKIIPRANLPRSTPPVLPGYLTETAEEIDMKPVLIPPSEKNELAAGEVTKRSIFYSLAENTPTDDDTLVVSFMESDDELDSESKKNTNLDPFDESFPRQNVLELKQRLDSVSSLNPGRLVYNVSDDLVNETFSDSNTEASKVVKLRKRRNSNRDVQSIELENIPVNTFRVPVVGTTRMIKWRSLDDNSDTEMLSKSEASKANSLPADLRQSFPGPTLLDTEPASSYQGTSESSLASESTEDSDEVESFETADETNSVNSHQLDESSWESASDSTEVDVVTDDKISHEESDAKTEFSDIAPMPPFESNVEQIAFDSSDMRSHRHGDHKTTGEFHSRLQPGFRSVEVSGNSSVSPVNITHATDNSNQKETESDTIPTETNLQNGPAYRLAILLSVPYSTAASMLGTGILFAFVAGLWMIRNTVRARNS